MEKEEFLRKAKDMGVSVYEGPLEWILQAPEGKCFLESEQIWGENPGTYTRWVIGFDLSGPWDAASVVLDRGIFDQDARTTDGAGGIFDLTSLKLLYSTEFKRNTL